jgi:hypothetical protein
LLAYYDKVHNETQRWVGIQFDVLPPGIKVLAQTEVYGNKPQG